MVAAAPPPATLPLEHVTTVAAPTRTAPHGWTVHTVRAGETLDGIAARYRTTVGALASRNHVRTPGLIHAGDRLSVPRTARRTPPERAARRAPCTSCAPARR